MSSLAAAPELPPCLERGRQRVPATHHLHGEPENVAVIVGARLVPIACFACLRGRLIAVVRRGVVRGHLSGAHEVQSMG